RIAQCGAVAIEHRHRWQRGPEFAVTRQDQHAARGQAQLFEINVRFADEAIFADGYERFAGKGYFHDSSPRFGAALANSVATASMWSRHSASDLSSNSSSMPVARAAPSGGWMSARAAATWASALASRKMRAVTASRTFVSIRSFNSV